MKRTYRYFSMCGTGLLALLAVSCSTDESLEKPNPEFPSNAEAYVSLSIVTPSGNNVIARSAEEGNGTSPATDDENAVETVKLYLFNPGNGGTITSNNLQRSYEKLLELPVIEVLTFTDAIKATDEQGTIHYETHPQKVNIPNGNYFCYAVINGEPSETITQHKTTLKDLLDSKITYSNAVKTSTNTRLIMTSRVDLTVSQKNEVTLPISSVTTANNNSSNPAHFKVNVERAVAKISYQATLEKEQTEKNKYKITTDKITGLDATCKISHYELVNLPQEGYTFRRVIDLGNNITYGGDLKNNLNYVCDPQTINKTTDAAKASNFHFNWFGDTKFYKDNPKWEGHTWNTVLPEDEKSYTLLSYTMENTMLQEYQLNGFSTGIIFRGIYIPSTVKVWNGGPECELKAYETGGFCLYENQLFLITDKTNSLLEAFKSKRGEGADAHYDAMVKSGAIREYKAVPDGGAGAYCYYKYWIKHLANSDPKDMGVMEFGIVRNNDYQLKISSISGLGDNNPDITPSDLDEAHIIYAKVELQIKPWIKRAQNIEL